jgi:cysteine-rich repeat protein
MAFFLGSRMPGTRALPLVTLLAVLAGAGLIASAHAACGDGVVDPGEQCDDGNALDGDGCDGNCTLTACGNGVVTSGEECDDGNAHGCDGCDPGCQEEPSGLSWCLLGGPVGGTIIRVATDPVNTDTVYVGSDGGVFKTVNGAQTWFAAEEGISGSGVSGIAVSPADPAVLLAGRAGESSAFGILRPRGIYRSSDGGAQWTLAQSVASDPFGFGFGVGDVGFDPSNASMAYAAAGAGVFRSTDGGVGWQLVSSTPSCRLAAATSGTLLVAAVDFVRAGHVNRSTDGGATWTTVLDGLLACPARLGFAPSDPQRAFVTTTNGVYRSLDGGATWALVYPPSPAPPFTYSAQGLAVDPHDAQIVFAHVVGGCQGCGLPQSELITSVDGGDTWSLTGFGAAEVYDLAFTAGVGGQLFAGTGLGVFSLSGSGAWVARNAGLLAADIRAVATDPSLPERLYLATEGIGVWRTDDAGATWSIVNQAEMRSARALLVHPTDSATLLAGTYGGGVFRSSNGGVSWIARNQGLAVPQGYDARYVQALAMDPQDPATLFAGLSEGLFRSTDGADSWAYVDVGTAISASAIAIDPTGAAIYVGTMGGAAIYRSIDGGSSWSSGSLTGQVNDLLIDAADPARVYAATSGGFARSLDSGLTWTAITGAGSPRILTALAPDPGDTATIYATAPGTGVYRSGDRGDTWQLVAPSGLSNALVWDVAVLAGGGGGALSLRALASGGPAAAHVLVVSRDAGGASGVFRATAGGIPTTTTTTGGGLSTTTTTTLPSQGEQLLSGKKLVLRDSSDVARRGAVVVSLDDALSLGGGPGGSEDPVVTDGSFLRIRTGAGCAGPCDATYPLERSRWTYAGSASNGRGYRYRNRYGVVHMVVVRPGKLLKLAAGGAMGHTLAVTPDAVDVVVQLGTRRFCMRFGGTTTFRAGRRFKAKDAPAPATCAP